MRHHRSFTPRGFEDFADLIDTHGQQIVVRESSSLAPRVWIFVHSKELDPHLLVNGAHLDPDQALVVAAALVEFASRHTPRTEKEAVA
jgi:hypothetical protein